MEPQTQSHQNSLLIPLAIVVAGGMVALAIYFGNGGVGQTGAKKDVQKAAVIEAVSSKDRILGDIGAPVTIVEYSDLECPFCKVFHNTMNQIATEYKGKVSWVFRHFPIEQLHSKAIKEAEASECAADQGGNTIFWKYIDRVFATTNSNDSLDPKMLPQIASDLGLNVSLFNECLSGGKYTKKINDDIAKAVEAGARGTPYSIILDKSGKQIGTINGAEPIENVRIKIDAALK